VPVTQERLLNSFCSSICVGQLAILPSPLSLVHFRPLLLLPPSIPSCVLKETAAAELELRDLGDDLLLLPHRTPKGGP